MASNDGETSKTDNAINEVELLDEQMKQIETEQKQFPLVGQKLPFDIIIMEYDAKISPDFHAKANELAESYSDVRQIRGDGNCFYRAVLVGIIDTILRNEERAKKFLSDTKEWNNRLVKLGFPDWTTNDFCEYFIDWLKEVIEKKKSHENIFSGLNEDGHSNYLLMFLRLITSGYLKEHAEEYSPFIENGQTMAEYCGSEIEAMWKDADHLGIIGLVNATGFKIRIEYMDRTAAPNGGFHYDIPAEPVGPADFTLLYRPGHYDVVYTKK